MFGKCRAYTPALVCLSMAQEKKSLPFSPLIICYLHFIEQMSYELMTCNSNSKLKLHMQDHAEKQKLTIFKCLSYREVNAIM